MARLFQNKMSTGKLHNGAQFKLYNSSAFVLTVLKPFIFYILFKALFVFNFHIKDFFKRSEAIKGDVRSNHYLDNFHKSGSLRC